MKLKTYISTLFLLVFTVMSFGQDVMFEMIPGKTKSRINESLEVRFIVNKEVDTFIAPIFNDFKVLFIQTVRRVKGGATGNVDTITYNYSLLPQRKGLITINEAVVIYDGKPYKTTPEAIEVTDWIEITEDELNDSFHNNIQIAAEIEKVDAVLGEEITVVYKMYFSQGIRNSHWELGKFPESIGYEAEFVPIKNKNVGTIEINGEPYKYLLHHKMIVKPTRVGIIEIRAWQYTITVEIPFNKDGEQILIPVTRNVQTDPIYIHVST